MLDHMGMYEALYMLTADEGRERALFGDCQPLARPYRWTLAARLRCRLRQVREHRRRGNRLVLHAHLC